MNDIEDQDTTPLFINNHIVNVKPVIVFTDEDDLANWIENNVLAVKDVEAYLAEKGHPIQHRAVYYAIDYGRLKAWRTASGTHLTLKRWVDQCWELDKE
jgi:hypothetical protein